MIEGGKEEEKKKKRKEGKKLEGSERVRKEGEGEMVLELKHIDSLTSS